jgi:uncharacterized protein YjeT (DUF2065 family)
VATVLTTTAAIFAFLLVATGLVKVAKPTDTARAIRAMGLPAGDNAARFLGLVEITIGLSVVMTLSIAALAAQGLMYLAFLVWIVAALQKAVPIASCGCLGTPDTPPYWGHVLVNLLAVSASFGAAVSMSSGDLVGGGLQDALQLAVAVVGAAICWLVIGEAARLEGARRP